MRQKLIVPFEISSIDGLGQGVSKLDGKVTFIAKTTVGDKGEAEILAERKGVAFAKVHRMDETSSQRVKPECVHFDSCPSCHFLHVDYQKELHYKKENFKRLFRKFSLPEVQVVPALRRLHYRNRVQLHYSLKSKLLGMRDPQSHRITEIPNCLVGIQEVKDEIFRLYENQQWLKEIPPGASEGHVEIYWINDELKVSWNKPYADGGFTQVFEEMNQKLKEVILSEWQSEHPIELLDLFAGNGNLSNDLNHSKRLCVDLYGQLPAEDFISQNIYDDGALKRVKKELQRRNLKIQRLLLDPPRSGLKNLSDWVLELKPQSIAYVSCDPHTMARDLGGLQGYSPTKAFLIDFFPSTFHFESFIILERNS